MTQKPFPAKPDPKSDDPKSERAARLKAALKTNMARRKAQARARGEGAPKADGQEA